jgi:hypothetical protein
MRQYRNLSDETRQKISDAMKGKKKTAAHKAAIAHGMLLYWAQIPYLKESTEINNENVKPQKDEADV